MVTDLFASPNGTGVNRVKMSFWGRREVGKIRRKSMSIAVGRVQYKKTKPCSKKMSLQQDSFTTETSTVGVGKKFSRRCTCLKTKCILNFIFNFPFLSSISFPPNVPVVSDVFRLQLILSVVDEHYTGTQWWCRILSGNSYCLLWLRIDEWDRKIAKEITHFSRPLYSNNSDRLRFGGGSGRGVLEIRSRNHT